MRLFEAAYAGEDFKSFCRFYDTESKQSLIYGICESADAYVQDDFGNYSHLVNKEKYRKIGPKDYKIYKNKSSQIEGKCSPSLVHIRNNYWKFEGSNYNMNPCIFYLDIETTAHKPVDVLKCDERIVSIQIFHNLSNTNIILTTDDAAIDCNGANYKFDKEYDFKILHIICETETQLLQKYFECVNKLKPLLVIAHNGEGFDFKYLWDRTERMGITEGFSPFGKSKLKDKTGEDKKPWYSIEAPGVFYLDNLILYKRFRLAPRSSYSLDYLAEVELGERKVNHSCYATFDGFRTGTGYIKPETCPAPESTLEYALYNAKSQDEIIQISKKWFLHYSIIDTYLLYKMDNKLKLSSILIGLASIMGVNINQALGTVQPWSNYIRNYCSLKNIIMPSFKERNAEPDVVGGYVKEPVAGKYDWVYVVDVTSMYPSQMMAFNMSPDTFVPQKDWPKELYDEVNNLKLSKDEQFHLKEYFSNPQKYSKLKEILNKYNLCGALNGAFFDKSYKGVIPILVEHVFKQRKLAKKEMLKNEKLYEETKDPKYNELATELNIKQNALKIAINGLYGALGNPAFDIFNEDIANAITANARFYVQLFSKNIENKKQNKCIYNDTDAGDFEVSNEVKLAIQNLELQKKIDFIDNYIETEIQPIINDSSSELGNIFNALDASKISAKREVIAEKAIFIAKKRYIMKIWDSEGVRFKEPHMKMMGIDLVRSSTPNFSKKYLREAIDVILDKSEAEVIKYLNETKTKFLSSSLFDIAKTSSVNKLNYKFGDKAIPINSRAVMVSNDYISKNCADRYNTMQVGEKIKMLYLVKNNPLHENIFAFNDNSFANIFKDYIDYDLNFEKFFLKPLEIMTEPLKYNINKNTEVVDVW